MFIFVEGDQVDIELGLDVIQERILVSGELTFANAIKMLASRSKQFVPTVTIFTNFFSKGCHKMLDSHRRGLERIAMGDHAIEVINKERRVTRFLPTIKGHSIDDNLKVLKSMINDYVGHGIGRLNIGNTLIIGESPGPNSHGYNTPFVGTGCGMWLLRHMDVHGIDESSVYWTNAKDAFGKELSNDFMVYLRPLRIITLGNEAKLWAQKRSISHEVINLHHPQYWLRFRSKEEYPLLQLLK